jgi:hypothetical protein
MEKNTGSYTLSSSLPSSRARWYSRWKLEGRSTDRWGRSIEADMEGTQHVVYPAYKDNVAFHVHASPRHELAGLEIPERGKGGILLYSFS